MPCYIFYKQLYHRWQSNFVNINAFFLMLMLHLFFYIFNSNRWVNLPKRGYFLFLHSCFLIYLSGQPYVSLFTIIITSPCLLFITLSVDWHKILRTVTIFITLHRKKWHENKSNFTLWGLRHYLSTLKASWNENNGFLKTMLDFNLFRVNVFHLDLSDLDKLTQRHTAVWLTWLCNVRFTYSCVNYTERLTC